MDPASATLNKKRRISPPSMAEPAREIPVFTYAPGKTAYHISTRLKNEPGALTSVLGRMADEKINLVSIAASVRPEDEEAAVSIFAFPSGKALAPAQVKRLVDSSPSVLWSRVDAAKGGMIIEDAFPVTMGTGDRVMILRTELFASMLKAVRDTYGTGGDVIVFGQGLASGRSDAEALARAVGRDEAVAHMAELASLYTALGWGRVTLEALEISPLRARFRLGQNMECVGQSSKRPCSQFMRGHLTGVAEVLLGVKAECTEVECVAKGDACCVFEVVAE